MVGVNSDLCKSVGLIIKELRIKGTFRQRPFLTAGHNDETRLSMLFNAVAICHQTRNLYSPGHQLYGWDYIEFVFSELANNKSPLLIPEFVSELSLQELQELLLSAFSDNGNPAESTLDTIEERAGLYSNLNKHILRFHRGSYRNILTQTNNLLLNSASGFYELLKETDAFSDPMRKKSSFLAKLLFDANLYSVKDEANYIPIVDYHMQRVLLRLGCIQVNDPELDFKLKNKQLLDSDQAVRESSIDAFRIISEVSGHKLWVMNDFFWPMGRSCCNETTLCESKVCIKNPCTFQLMIESGMHNRCIFDEVCRGFLSGKPAEYFEPMVKTHYY